MGAEGKPTITDTDRRWAAAAVEEMAKMDPEALAPYQVPWHIAQEAVRWQRDLYESILASNRATANRALFLLLPGVLVLLGLLASGAAGGNEPFLVRAVTGVSIGIFFALVVAVFHCLGLTHKYPGSTNWSTVWSNYLAAGGDAPAVQMVADLVDAAESETKLNRHIDYWFGMAYKALHAQTATAALAWLLYYI